MPSYARRMTDVTKRAGLGRPAVIAIGFAVVALVTSVVAVIVVLRRPGEPAAVIDEPARGVIDLNVEAAAVTKLKRDLVEREVDGKGDFIGIRITDEALRVSLGLEPGDVIVALNGRTLKREFDVYDAVLGMSMMDASIVYVEIMREHAPVLVRWKLAGDLRSARRDPSTRRTSPPSTTSPFSNPFTATPDPLVDSIRRIDALHYEVPRTTIDRLLANPDVYARQARIVPAMRNGQPDGFKLYVISPGSLWMAIGLANGDTIRSVNGHDLSTPDKLVSLYARLKDATELQILVGRRSGGVETIVITVQ